MTLTIIAYTICAICTAMAAYGFYRLFKDAHIVEQDTYDWHRIHVEGYND